jgi:Ca2+-binding EF-hand superfamily protein
MKKLLVIALTLSVSGFVALAADGDKKEKRAADNPRVKTLEKYDKNSNGKLDEDEREAMRKDRQAEALKKYDKNGDGKLDASEREAAKADRRKAPEGKKPAEKKDK